MSEPAAAGRCESVDDGRSVDPSSTTISPISTERTTLGRGREGSGDAGSDTIRGTGCAGRARAARRDPACAGVRAPSARLSRRSTVMRSSARRGSVTTWRMTCVASERTGRASAGAAVGAVRILAGPVSTLASRGSRARGADESDDVGDAASALEAVAACDSTPACASDSGGADGAADSREAAGACDIRADGSCDAEDDSSADAASAVDAACNPEVAAAVITGREANRGCATEGAREDRSCHAGVSSPPVASSTVAVDRDTEAGAGLTSRDAEVVGRGAGGASGTRARSRRALATSASGVKR
jgi:hypothetical protein